MHIDPLTPSQYPTHTPQEWRNYFNNELKPIIQEKRRSKSIAVERTSEKKAGPSQNPRSPEVTSTRRSPKSLSKSTVGRRASSERSNTEIAEPQAGAGRDTDPLLSDEKQFKVYVTALAEVLDLEVDFNPVICGESTSLFRIWQVVKGKYGGIDEVERRKIWPSVSRSLELSEPEGSNAADAEHQLRYCYSVILGDVESTRNEYWETTDSQERLRIEAQLRDAIEMQTQTDNNSITEDDASIHDDSKDDDGEVDLDLPLFSRTNLATNYSRKRSLPAENIDGYSADSSHSKRQRLDKNREIETHSSPGDRLGEENNFSIAIPPLRFRSPILGDLTDEEDSLDSIKKQSPKKPPKKQLPQGAEIIEERETNNIVEPETQDFHFPAGNSQTEEETGDKAPNKSLPSSPVATGQGSTAVGQPNLQDDAPQQSKTESEPESEDSELDLHVDRLGSKGYSEENIIKGLDATSWELGISHIAEKVTEALEQGLDIPEDLAGAWTSSDDKDLLKNRSGPLYRSLARKHGLERLRARIKFLKQRAADPR